MEEEVIFLEMFFHDGLVSTRVPPGNHEELVTGEKPVELLIPLFLAETDKACEFGLHPFAYTGFLANPLFRDDHRFLSPFDLLASLFYLGEKMIRNLMNGIVERNGNNTPVQVNHHLLLSRFEILEQ
ncbi:MAG: hypothetical protein RBG13Loki_2506 [Promethearchaeota archaeon CR_4]|nr:MAG: hypothetical protein RBG13Loki_2506 [Candidatus Lokiarchaeota archaeon CR_4]